VRSGLVKGFRMKIGFSGSRIGMTVMQAIKFKNYLENMNSVEEFHHGDCVGCDEKAHGIVIELGIPVFIHPPEINTHRAYCKGYKEIYEVKPYLERNNNIVQVTDFIIVCPITVKEEKRSGTWATFRRARYHKKKTLIIWPNGGLQYQDFGKQFNLF
jgi:hypothetical protein